MKTKKEFIDEIYFGCKSAIDDDSIQEVNNKEGENLFTFYLDEDNETLKIWIDGEYRSIYEIDEETAYLYARDICNEYLYMDADEVSDDRTAMLEKGIEDWYDMTGKVIDSVKKYFNTHKTVPCVEINLPNNFYFLIVLERKVIFKYIRMDKEGKIVCGISEPVYHDDQIFDWYNHEIDFENVLQDAITLSDIMHEFYVNTRN